MSEFELQAQPREVSGKAESRRMRREQNIIPAVIYGAGKDSEHITLEHNKVIHALENEAFYSHILTLNVGSKSEKVILKDLQRHPAKINILHMDFLRIKADEKLKMNIPLHFINEDTAVGVKDEGGVISHNMTDVEIECLPANLPEFIEVDLADVKLGGNIHLSEVKLPKGVELVGFNPEHDEVVANIHEPHVEVEPEPETPAETEEAAAEGEGDTAEKPAEDAGDTTDKENKPE